MIYNLLLFLAVFGQESGDIQPAFPTFFQPHGEVTNFRFTNLSRPDTTGFDFIWLTQNKEFHMRELPLDSLHPAACEGAFSLTLRAINRYTLQEFERTECVWVSWSYYDYSDCQDTCTIIDASSVIIWEDYVPLQYQTNCGLDYNCSGIFDTNDLLDLLAQ